MRGWGWMLLLSWTLALSACPSRPGDADDDDASGADDDDASAQDDDDQVDDDDTSDDDDFSDLVGGPAEVSGTIEDIPSLQALYVVTDYGMGNIRYSVVAKEEQSCQERIEAGAAQDELYDQAMSGAITVDEWEEQSLALMLEQLDPPTWNCVIHLDGDPEATQSFTTVHCSYYEDSLSPTITYDGGFLGGTVVFSSTGEPVAGSVDLPLGRRFEGEVLVGDHPWSMIFEAPYCPR